MPKYKIISILRFSLTLMKFLLLCLQFHVISVLVMIYFAFECCCFSTPRDRCRMKMGAHLEDIFLSIILLRGKETLIAGRWKYPFMGSSYIINMLVCFLLHFKGINDRTFYQPCLGFIHMLTDCSGSVKGKESSTNGKWSNRPVFINCKVL